MEIKNKRLALALAVASGSMVWAGCGHAAGFAIIEQGVSGLGNAYAGGAAAAEDATTVFFNPAGMTMLPGTQMSAAAHIIVPQAEYSDRGSYVNPNLTGGVAIAGSLPGDPSDDGGQTALVPNLYFTSELGDGWWMGLGVNAPFGLTTEYDDDWVGRYHAIKSSVKTININPSVAYQVSDMVSLGAGISAQYLDAELTNAVDFGTVCFGTAEVFFGPGTCAGAGVLPLTADGKAKIKGTSWDWGFNLGALIHFNEATRLGLAYRSKISHDLEGDASFQVPANFQALLNLGIPLFSDTGASAGIDLPETASASLFHQISPSLAIMGDITWTKWERFDELRVEFDNPYQPDSVQPEEWDNSMRYSLGLTYKPSDTWTFRLGAAYDETPIPNADLRTPRIPGNDRTWLAIGLGYRMNQDMSLDVGYAHLFVDDTKIDATDHSTGHQLVGEFDNTVDILSAQFNMKF